MDLHQLHQALQQPPGSLGVLPEFAGLRPCFQVQWVKQTESTNHDLMAQMASGAVAGTVLIAATQRAGRGQWGRQWQSAAGGLYLSLGLRPEMTVERSLYLTLASAWGLATSLANLGIPAQVKWPNDLVVQGRKLGGILTDTRVQGDRVQAVVVGLGLNVQNPVPPTGISLGHLSKLPEPPPGPLNTLEGVAAVALYGLMQGYSVWQNQGDQAFLALYQQRMTHLGQPVVIEDQSATVTGLAPSGNLSVRVSSDGSCAPLEWEIKPGEVTLGYNA
ncbi:MAG: biotin--[acetyl-CoA-carboxylase] ligase [Spirulina sp.]